MQVNRFFQEVMGGTFPIRKRYFVTKNNLPRLRYLSLTAVLAVLGSATLISGSKNLQANNNFDISDQAMSGSSYETTQNLQYESFEIPSEDIQLAYATVQGAIETTKKSTNKALNKLKQSVKSVPQKKASIEASEEPAPVKPESVSIALKRGDTLTGLLRKSGVGSSEAYRAVKALSKHYDPRKMKPGLKVNLTFGEDRIVDGETYKTIALLDVPYDAIKSARVSVNDDGKFTSKEHEKEVVYNDRTGAFEVEVSLFGSAEKAGIPHSIVAEAMRIYSWNVDFQRDLRKGDKLEVLYREKIIKETGEQAGSKEILYAKLTLSDKEKPIYRMEMKDGRVDYFQADGHSIRKALMKTPINGGRLSSGYGMRRHPVLGYNKMHKGLDFAAPTGTKIYAAGDGVIERIGWNGGFGKYIRIRHNGKLKTAYAHLHRFEKGLKAGDRVRQGQVIGRVGTTGRSTGPHLHYEVHVNGKQVNPRSVKLPTGEKLKGDMLVALNKTVDKYNNRFAMLHNQVRYADASDKQRLHVGFNE